MWISRKLFDQLIKDKNDELEKLRADKNNEIEYLRTLLSKDKQVRYSPEKVARGKEDVIAFAVEQSQSQEALNEKDKKLRDEAPEQISKLLGG